MLLLNSSYSFPCKTTILLIEGKKTEVNKQKPKLRRNSEFSPLAFLPLSMDDPCPVAPTPQSPHTFPSSLSVFSFYLPCVGEPGGR